MTPWMCTCSVPWYLRNHNVHTVPADHFHNETTFSLVWLLLDVAFAPFHGRIFVFDIPKTTLED